MTRLIARLPSLNAIIPVVAVIAFPVYAWTFIAWLWKLPSWMLFLTPLEILAIFSYAMTMALLECVLACVIVLSVCAVLPSPWFRDVFSVRGFWLAVGINLFFFGYGGWWMAFVSSGYRLTPPPMPLWSLVGVLAIILVVFLSMRLRIMGAVANWFSDRLVVFLYIQIPVSIISIFVVLLRNIF